MERRTSNRQSSDSNNFGESKPRSSEKSQGVDFLRRAVKAAGVAAMIIGAKAAEDHQFNDQQPLGAVDHYRSPQTSNQALAQEYAWLMRSSQHPPLETFSEKTGTPRAYHEEVSQDQTDTPSSSRNTRSNKSARSNREVQARGDISQHKKDTSPRQLEQESSKMNPDLQSYSDALKQNKEAQKVLKDVLTN